MARRTEGTVQGEEVVLGNADGVIEADQDLLLSEILNSLSVTMLLVHLEAACNVQIPPEDVTLENFSTLESIAGYVQRLGESTG